MVLTVEFVEGIDCWTIVGFSGWFSGWFSTAICCSVRSGFILFYSVLPSSVCDFFTYIIYWRYLHELWNRRNHVLRYLQLNRVMKSKICSQRICRKIFSFTKFVVAWMFWVGLVWLVWFYGISTLVGCLMPNPVLYIYIKSVDNILKRGWALFFGNN